MSQKSFYIQSGNLYIVPICHYRFEFAWYVNRAVCEISPDHIAVELPGTLEKHFIQAVERFPYLSVIFYQNGKGEYIYYPVEPADPLCEAVRCGLDLNIPVHFTDLDVDEYPLLFDPVPDSYSLSIIGLEKYWKAYDEIVNSGGRQKLCSSDEMRETQMAYSLQKILKEDKKVLMICGMAHVRGILEKMKSPQMQPLGKVLRKDMRLFNLSLSSIREVTGETPYFIAAYEMLRGNHKKEQEGEWKNEEGKVISFADKLRERDASRKKLRDNESKEKKASSSEKEKISPLNPVEEKFPVLQLFLEKDKIVSSKPGEEDFPPVTAFNSKKDADFFSRLMKYLIPRLSGLDEVDDSQSLSDFTSLELDRSSSPYKDKQIEIHRFRTCEDRRDELLDFYRSLISASGGEDDGSVRTKYSLNYDLLDRQRLILRLIKRAAVYYEENTGDEIKSWQVRVLMKFSRNYSMVTGRLLPDFFQLITAARGVSDDNFGYEVWDIGSFYPWIDMTGELQTIDIEAEEVWLYGKKITLRRKKPRLRKVLRPVFLKDRIKEKKPGEWAKDFDRYCICSYPPEDIVIEDYGIYLRKKGRNMLSQEQARTVPFTTSLLDGIDVKETIRNWHEKKLYVRQSQQIQGGVGSVVVIFDEDFNDTKYPWQMTWQGEHGQESDMALYSTRPTDKVVGPGIARCEYGGFMMSYPPMRVWDVWGDPFYSGARSKGEVLLLAAIEYCLERYIAYIAAKPPRSWFRSFAGRLNKKIIYIPIGTLSPVTLKKIRVFHVLSGHKIREFAKDYIW